MRVMVKEMEVSLDTAGMGGCGGGVIDRILA